MLPHRPNTPAGETVQVRPAEGNSSPASAQEVSRDPPTSPTEPVISFQRTVPPGNRHKEQAQLETEAQRPVESAVYGSHKKSMETWTGSNNGPSPQMGRGPFFIDFASSINYFQKNRTAFVYGK